MRFMRYSLWMLLLWTGTAAHAQAIGEQLSIDPGFNGSEPVTMEANEIGYDQENGIVIARGKVTVMQGERVLNADEITFLQQRDKVMARGNVSMLQSTGDVYFADTVELTDDMKRGVIHNFRARLSDNSVFAAAHAVKPSSSVTNLTKAVYSPCKLCPQTAPFWQLKSSKVTVDTYDERVYYDNARLEMFGLPVLYTPYFAHPTPDAPAQSGLLTPEYSQSSNLGTVIKVPYYWRIAHTAEAVVIPWYISDDGALLESRYRQLTDGGSYQGEFSLTNAKNRDPFGNAIDGRELRGHLFAKGVESITDYSRFGFDVARSTDDTYLRRYGFGDQRSLFSTAYVEAARDRNYATLRALSIQGLRATDDADRTPLILPTLEAYYETEPLQSGLRFHGFANAQLLTRNEGADQRRIVVSGGVELPLVTSGGHIFTTSLNLRQDYYSVDDVTLPSSALFSGTTMRTIPQAALEWRYPLIRSFADGDVMTVEPIALAVVQPNSGNPPETGNEDNTLIELNDANLFSLNRMPGLDTVDSGSRVAYGARGQYLLSSGEAFNFLLGQNYNADDTTPFPNSVTPGESFSDYIGSVGFTTDPIELSYRFALKNDNLSANRTELVGSFTKPWLRFSSAYRELKNNQYLSNSREGIVNASLPVTDDWSLYGGARRDLELNEMIASAGGLLYRNECFNAMLQLSRTYTRDRDVEPSTSINFRIGFKNLGEFGDK